jgi:hypothetical protein
MRHRWLERDPAAIRVNGVLDNRQPQAAPRLARPARRRSTEERLEHGRRFIVLEARAAIFDRQPRCPAVQRRTRAEQIRESISLTRRT